jgi:2-C-methyl-D-erythritol 4-phosphate cytidylyltransferase
MFVSAILLAAGQGKRFKSKTPKPFYRLSGRPLLFYSLLQLDSVPAVKEIILLVNPQGRPAVASFLAHAGVKKTVRVVAGGRRRQDSVRNGLNEVSRQADMVLIHDAARPFIDQKIISDVLKRASRTGAAVAGVPVKATIKRVKAGRAVETLAREELWEIQTPQVFRKELLCQAFRKWGRVTVTDDASLVEKLGRRVSVVQGSYENIKVTTPEDALIAKAIAEKRCR